jgi:hypothetical protein
MEKHLADLQEVGVVPLGVLSFDVENDKFVISRFNDVSTEELNALLQKLNVHITTKAFL